MPVSAVLLAGAVFSASSSRAQDAERGKLPPAEPNRKAPVAAGRVLNVDRRDWVLSIDGSPIEWAKLDDNGTHDDDESAIMGRFMKARCS
jgi:hypothetical protein